MGVRWHVGERGEGGRGGELGRVSENSSTETNLVKVKNAGDIEIYCSRNINLPHSPVGSRKCTLAYHLAVLANAGRLSQTRRFDLPGIHRTNAASLHDLRHHQHRDACGTPPGVIAAALCWRCSGCLQREARGL
jgi:hypothetical protein